MSQLSNDDKSERTDRILRDSYYYYKFHGELCPVFSFWCDQEIVDELTTLEGPKGFNKWCANRGVVEETYIGGCMDNSALLAAEFASQYDYGIALAKGGLHMGYVFEKFGLPVIAVEPLTSRKVESQNFEVLDLSSSTFDTSKIEGKKIALLDRDIVTGETMSLAIDWASKLKPSSIDILLNLKGDWSKDSNGSLIIPNISNRVDSIFFGEGVSRFYATKVFEVLGK